MTVVDAESGRKIVIGDVVTLARGGSYRLVSVTDGMFEATVVVQFDRGIGLLTFVLPVQFFRVGFRSVVVPS